MLKINILCSILKHVLKSIEFTGDMLILFDINARTYKVN